MLAKFFERSRDKVWIYWAITNGLLLAYLILLLVALWPPLYWVLYFVILGTTAMVLFDYCFLARFMSLMPWNHLKPYSLSLFIKTFVSKPIAGSVQIKD